MLEINGNMLEGGGQIIRISACLSVYLMVPIRIINIRAKRPKPGLAAQHKTSIDSLVKLVTNVYAKFVELGSLSIELTYNDIFSVETRKNPVENIDIGTAGSITLVLQTIFIQLLNTESGLIQISGGTRVNWSPFIDYFEHVFLPMSKMKEMYNLEVKRHGFYPRGGGLIKLEKKIEPQYEIENQEFEYLDFGEIDKIQLLVFGVGKLKNSSIQISNLIKDKFKKISMIQIQPQDTKIAEFPNGAPTIGTLLLIHSKKGYKKGYSTFINKGENFQKFTDRIVGEFTEKYVNSKACVDDHLADQLIVLLGLSKPNGSIRVNYPITLHTETAITVCEMFLERKYEIMLDENDEDDFSHKTCVIICLKS